MTYEQAISTLQTRLGLNEGEILSANNLGDLATDSETLEAVKVVLAGTATDPTPEE